MPAGVLPGTKGYSGSDLKALCAEAAMGPVRELGLDVVRSHVGDLRGLTLEDFAAAVQVIKPSVGRDDRGRLEEWSRRFGTHGA